MPFVSSIKAFLSEFPTLILFIGLLDFVQRTGHFFFLIT